MEFVKKSIEEVSAMTAEAQTVYLKEKESFESEMKLKEIKKVSDLEAKSNSLEVELKSAKEEVIKLGTEVSKMKEVKSSPKKEGGLDEVFEKNAEGLKALSLKSNGANPVKFDVKVSTYGDIDSGLDFAPMRSGITDIPKKKTVFVDLFSRINYNGEFFKYAEQETVARAAGNVATCTVAPGESSETIKTQNISTKKIKDTLKFCSDYANDYPFVQGRLQALINDSVLFRLDQQILLGTGTGEELNSISSVSSEFSATNVDAPVGTTVKDANFVDLLGAMQTQIFVLGKENSYSPDTAVVNVLDWYKFVNSYKDGDNNYMNYRMTTVDGVPMVNGMKVITSPEVAANTCYVFDSSRGQLLVNQSYETSIAFENSTDWEADLVAIKASIRANLLVEANNVNAFMKCSDVALGITSITEV